MQTCVNHPALELRQRLSACSPRGFIRWDMSGRSLVICDAPRRQDVSAFLCALKDENTLVFVENGLLYLDFSEKAYRALLTLPLPSDFGNLEEPYWQEKLLLKRILTHPAKDQSLDIPLLRKGLLSSVCSDADFFLFFKTLRSRFAESLRKGEVQSLKICALFLFHRLWDNV